MGKLCCGQWYGLTQLGADVLIRGWEEGGLATKELELGFMFDYFALDLLIELFQASRGDYQEAIAKASTRCSEPCL